MTTHEGAHDEAIRLEDGLRLHGAAQASDHLLIATLLSGTQRRRAQIARGLLWEVGGLHRVGLLGLGELRELGLGRTEAARLLAAAELARRWRWPAAKGSEVREPRDGYRCVAPVLSASQRERFVVVVLDARNRPLHIATVAEGSADACPVDPREVFLPAVRERGSAVLVAHNHPSGHMEPSAEDLLLTQRLVKAGQTLGIPLLDHLIVGAERFISLAERGIVRVPGETGGDP